MENPPLPPGYVRGTDPLAQPQTPGGPPIPYPNLAVTRRAGGSSAGRASGRGRASLLTASRHRTSSSGLRPNNPESP